MKQGIQDEADNLYGVHMGEPWRDEGNHISIFVNGILNAVGTPENMITIRSDSPNPGIYDWNRFNIHNGILSYSIVENYRVLEPGDDTEISYNVLNNIGECGICANGRTVVEHNMISNAGHELIDMQNNSPIIRNNHLGPNEGVCIVVDLGSPEIVGNAIEGCDIGIAIINSASAPVLERNEFISNKQDIFREK